MGSPSIIDTLLRGTTRWHWRPALWLPGFKASLMLLEGCKGTNLLGLGLGRGFTLIFAPARLPGGLTTHPSESGLQRARDKNLMLFWLGAYV